MNLFFRKIKKSLLVLLLITGGCGDSSLDSDEENSESVTIYGASEDLKKEGVYFRSKSGGVSKEKYVFNICFLDCETINNQKVVNVVVSGGGYENQAELDKYFVETVWKSIHPIEEWGLVEYSRARYDGSWGYVSYRSFVEEQSTKGNDVIYLCQGYPPQEIVWCKGSFTVTGGRLVVYYLPYSVMYMWKEVHANVVDHVYKLINLSGS